MHKTDKVPADIGALMVSPKAYATQRELKAGFRWLRRHNRFGHAPHERLRRAAIAFKIARHQIQAADRRPSDSRIPTSDRFVAFRFAVVVGLDAPAVDDSAAGDRDAVGLRTQRFAVRGCELQRPDAGGPALAA